MSPILLALLANFSFASASILFTQFSKLTSSSWMNFYKCTIAAIGFAAVCWGMGYFQSISQFSLNLLVLSGLSGLMIGDIFLLKAFVHLGSGRTLMLFGFQPIFLGIASLFLFNQAFEPIRLTAVIFLILCLFSFSLESFKSKGHWELKGLGYAMIGVVLDASGLLMTRGAFEASADISPFLANFVRAVSASVGFLFLSQFGPKKFSLLEPLKKMSNRQRMMVTLASVFGTFLSLSLYLTAVKIGHLASISAIACTAPLFATLIETLLGRKKLNRYVFAGMIFFAIGFSILNLI